MRRFFDELNEATITGGYPDSGNNQGICTDDDLPPGTTVFGDKMVPVVVSNRLTGKTIKYVPAADLGQKWNYDEFEHSKSMGSHKSYSDTLDGLKKLLGNRTWVHTDARKMRMQQTKWDAYKGGDVKQTAKTQDDKYSYMELTKDGDTSRLKGDEPETYDYWKEVDRSKLTVDIIERIAEYVGDTVEQIDEEIVNPNDQKTISRAIMSGRNAKIVIKSLNLQANMTNYDDEVVITYTNSEDFTLTLVDIADTLGMTFKITKDGGKQAFCLIK